MPRRLLCLLAAASIATFPAMTRGQPASKSKVQEARSYVDAGLAAQRSHDYDTAILLYKKAYELVPHPVLLFDMAQAHRLAGRSEQALALYRKYLKAAPNGREAPTARELIAELEAGRSRSAERNADAAGDDAAASDELRAAGTDDETPSTPPGTRAARVTERSDDSSPGDHAPDSRARSPSPPGAPSLSPPGASPVMDTVQAEVRDRDRRSAPFVSLAKFQLGMALANRQLAYDIRPDFMGPTPGRLSASGGALQFEAEIYPFALADPQHQLARLGVAAMYQKTVGLSLQAPDPDPVNLATAQVDASRLRFGPRLRLDIADSSSLALGIDYARRRYFLVDRSSPTAFDIPDVDYTSLDPSVALDVPVQRTLALFARLAGILMIDAGPISERTKFGKSTAFGVELAAGVSVALTRHIALRGALEYSQVWLSFDISNQETAGRDNDFLTKDIRGATDRSLAAIASVSLAY
jgi:tetratricopeptide (TPR) repeat protein